MGNRIEIENEGFPTSKLPDAVLAWTAEIRLAADETGVPATLIAGVMAVESKGKQNAVSSADAYGLMQLLPSTASLMAGRTVTGTELLNNPALNIILGARYLRRQLDRYKGNVVRAVAGYNAGGAYCKGKCMNRWGLVADCTSDGVGVDYPTKTFSYANSAAETAIGAPAESTTSLWWVLPLAAIAGAATAVGFSKYKRGQRK